MVLKLPRAALAAATVTTVLCATVVSANAAVPTDTTELREAVTADAIMDHLAELQKIADNNGDTRASGTPDTTRRSTTSRTCSWLRAMR